MISKSLADALEDFHNLVREVASKDARNKISSDDNRLNVVGLQSQSLEQSITAAHHLRSTEGVDR